MDSKYINLVSDAENIVREEVQKNILEIFSKTDIFDQVIFCGGTCLRIIYNSQRYSEDLDFDLVKDDNNFSLKPYIYYLDNELSNLDLVSKSVVETRNSNVERAFANVNMRSAFARYGINDKLISTVHRNRLLKIKIEVATISPKYGNHSLVHSADNRLIVRAYDKSTLFAGKLAAILQRDWGIRTKGRDYYDFLYYINNNIEINASYLSSSLSLYGVNEEFSNLGKTLLKDKLELKFRLANLNSAIDDAYKFVIDKSELDNWDHQLFISSLSSLDRCPLVWSKNDCSFSRLDVESTSQCDDFDDSPSPCF